MSYIRSTENIEGIYAWGNDRDQIEIATCGPILCIPNKLFLKLCKKSDGFADLDLAIKAGKLSVQEVWVNSKKLSKEFRVANIAKNESESSNYVVVELAYKNRKIHMFAATWYFFCKSYLKHWEEK